MKRFLVGIGCVVFLWNVAMAGIVFDFNDTPATTVVKYDTSVDPAVLGSPQTVDVVQLLASHTYFWANSNPADGAAFADGRGDGIYDLTTMKYVRDGAAVTLRATAYKNWGYYSTAGTALTQNFSSTPADHGDNTYPNSTFIYAPDTANTGLVLFNGAFGGESETVLPYVSPMVTFENAQVVESIDVANTCYVANTIKNGNMFSAAMSYANDDFFGITVSGLDASGNVIAGKSKSFLLADYLTYADDQVAVDSTAHELTYFECTDADGNDIGTGTTVSYTSLANGTADDWSRLMLDEFGEVFGLKFSLFSSDYGERGFNTPGYFALDNLILRGAAGGETDVPEPAAWLLLAAGTGWLGIQIRRKISGRSLLHVER